VKRAADDAVGTRSVPSAPVPQQATGDRVGPERLDADRLGPAEAVNAGDAVDLVDDFTDGDAHPEATVAAEAETADGASPESALDERQLKILEFEKRWWRHAGSKEQAIRDAFELSPTRYYQLLNALLDEPAALAYDPVLIQRLRRMRATRTRSRRPTS
jgi:hypothetical protein